MLSPAKISCSSPLVMSRFGRSSTSVFTVRPFIVTATFSPIGIVICCCVNGR
jgi:hypothetical protein